MRRRSTPCKAAFTSSGVDNSRYGIRLRWTRVSYRIGESLCRFSLAFERAISHCCPSTSKVGYVLCNPQGWLALGLLKCLCHPQEGLLTLLQACAMYFGLGLCHLGLVFWECFYF